MPHTHSQLETFLDTCPRQYKAKYVTKDVKFEETDATRWGNYVHDELEKALKTKQPLPADLAPHQSFLDALVRKGGNLVPEGSIAFDKDRNPVNFFDRKAYFRGKIDVSAVRSPIAIVLDWKTGKVKDDVKQLVRYALLTLAKYPEVEEVRSSYVWFQEKKLSKPVIITRGTADEHYQQLDADIENVEHAIEVDAFPPKPSGLCYGWCQVTGCEHWKPKKVKR